MHCIFEAFYKFYGYPQHKNEAQDLCDKIDQLIHDITIGVEAFTPEEVQKKALEIRALSIIVARMHFIPISIKKVKHAR